MARTDRQTDMYVHMNITNGWTCTEYMLHHHHNGEINSMSQFFSDAPLAQTPANFGAKCCFLVIKSQTQVVYQIWSCSFQWLQKYVGGPKFFDVPLAKPPPILVLNVVFGKQHPVPKWCKNFVAHVPSDCLLLGAVYKFAYLLTYLLTYLRRPQCVSSEIAIFVGL